MTRDEMIELVTAAKGRAGSIGCRVCHRQANELAADLDEVLAALHASPVGAEPKLQEIESALEPPSDLAVRVAPSGADSGQTSRHVGAEPPDLVVLVQRAKDARERYRTLPPAAPARTLWAEFQEAQNDVLAWTPAQAEPAAPWDSNDTCRPHGGDGLPGPTCRICRGDASARPTPAAVPGWSPEHDVRLLTSHQLRQILASRECICDSTIPGTHSPACAEWRRADAVPTEEQP